MDIKKLKRMVNRLEEEQENMIDGKYLMDQLQRKRDNHNDQALMVNNEAERNYQDGYADGLQEAMNTVVSLLDEKREIKASRSINREIEKLQGKASN